MLTCALTRNPRKKNDWCQRVRCMQWRMLASVPIAVLRTSEILGIQTNRGRDVGKANHSSLWPVVEPTAAMAEWTKPLAR
jgi:hypothetical protein